MSGNVPTVRSHVTLGLCTVLHAFTHAYGTILVPLYLLIVADLKLRGVNAASLVVTVYGLVYCLVSYVAGVMADRADRRFLLGVGLVGNAAAITLMGVTRQYEWLLVLGVVAGLFGALFHPSANALVSAHYPKNPGMAIGFLAVGAGVGFFLGPQYAGWRAEDAHWTLGGAYVADWQRPLLEAGAAGLAFGLVFLVVAQEAEKRAKPTRHFAPQSPEGNGDSTTIPRRSAAKGKPLGPLLRRRMFAVAVTLMCRDFAGVASITLASIYLQKAHYLSAKQTGFIVGAMMLVGVIVNPLCVYLSPGRRRLPALVSVLTLAGLVVLAVPLVTVRFVLPVLCVFQAFHPRAYLGPFGLVSAMMLAATASAAMIAKLGTANLHAPIRPMSEATPKTLEPVG